MLRCLNKYAKSIHTSPPANTLMYVSGLIHGLIGLDVPPDTSWLDEEDVSLLTTKHSAIITTYVTQPIQTQQFRKARLNDG